MTEEHIHPADEKPISIVFTHCKSVYDEMMQQAREETLNDDELEGTVKAMVYEGHLTKLVTGDLGLATPRYTIVLKHLKAMGCIEQLQRGGGGAPSRWRLLQAPDEDAFRVIVDMKRPTSGKVAVVEQQLRDMNRRVLALEAERKFTLDTLQSMGQTIAAYTKLATDLKAQLHNHFGIHHDADQMSEVRT